MKLILYIDQKILQISQWTFSRWKIWALIFVFGIALQVLKLNMTQLFYEIDNIPQVQAKTLTAKPQEADKTIQEQVWDILDGYGLSFREKIEAVGIISCESAWNPFAIGVNKNGSKDLGLWQTNEVHQKITRGCAFDYVCQTKYVMENIYLKQKNWSAWMCSK